MKTSVTKFVTAKGVFFVNLFLIGVITIVSLSWQQPAQDRLTGKWRGTVNIPDPSICVFEFKGDSMLLYHNESLIESSSYKQNGDTLTVQKLSGMSPCNTEEGKYTYKIDKDVLTFTTINDDCPARSGAFSPEGYIKQSN